MERVLDAAEKLLESRSFESIPVSELVRAAGTSVGAFYTRFRDKGALLPALYERYDAWVSGQARRMARSRAWQGMGPEATVSWVVHQMVRLLRHRPYLQRAMALHARQHPEKIDGETRARRQRQFAFLGEALLANREHWCHADPERAVQTAVFMAAAVCREAVLFRDAPHSQATAMSYAEVEREVARQMLGYLRTPATTE